MQITSSRRTVNLPFHVVRRLDTPKKQYWAIKVAGFLVALLLAGIICTMLTPGSFGLFYKEMFLGVFDPSDSEVLLELLETAGLLLLVAFALAPAFKMKFWNLGGEGQILIGCLVTAGICKFMNASDIVLIVLSLVCAVGAGIVWAVIPAIFKAYFNTNETLFTLMMNYVAIALIALCINIWVPSGSQVFGSLINGNLPDFGIKYILNLIIVAIVVTAMIVYLKKTKHGYELSVVGESVNTARYVGINVKKVIIRTMILSGALCGLVGFLLVAGHHHTLSTGLAGGRGFTGVLVAWLGGFNPGQMVLYAFLVAIFQCGSKHAASYMAMSSTEFSAIITGMFFLVVIASEFFVNYHMSLKPEFKEKLREKYHAIINKRFLLCIRNSKVYKFIKRFVFKPICVAINFIFTPFVLFIRWLKDDKKSRKEDNKEELLTTTNFSNEVKPEPEHIATDILHKDDIESELNKEVTKKEMKKATSKKSAKKVEEKKLEPKAKKEATKQKEAKPAAKKPAAKKTNESSKEAK